jgi:hypothetical protein
MLKCIDYVVPDKIKTMLKKKLEELPSKHKVTTHKTLQWYNSYKVYPSFTLTGQRNNLYSLENRNMLPNILGV